MLLNGVIPGTSLAFVGFTVKGNPDAKLIPLGKLVGREAVPQIKCVETSFSTKVYDWLKKGEWS